MSREEIFSPSDLVVRRLNFNCKWLNGTCINQNWWNWKCLYCFRQNLESSDDGSVGMLSVLDADWSVVTKYGGVFDLMNIDELSYQLQLLLAARSSAVRGRRATSYFWHKSLCCHKDFYDFQQMTQSKRNIVDFQQMTQSKHIRFLKFDLF